MRSRNPDLMVDAPDSVRTSAAKRSSEEEIANVVVQVKTSKTETGADASSSTLAIAGTEQQQQQQAQNQQQMFSTLEQMQLTHRAAQEKKATDHATAMKEQEEIHKQEVRDLQEATENSLQSANVLAASRLL